MIDPSFKASFEQFEQIKQWVVDPLIRELRSDLQSLQSALLDISKRFERQFEQFEKALLQTDVLIRNAADPVTGSITRPEMKTMQEAADKEHDLIRMEMDKIKRDHEDRLRELERPPWVARLAIAAFAALAAAVLAAGPHLTWH